MQELLRTGDQSPLHRLLGFYQTLIDANEADDFSRGCLVANLSNEVAKTDASLADVCNQNFLLLIKGTTAVLAEAQQVGEVRTDFSAAALAEYVHTGFYGQFPRMKATNSRASLDNWLRMTSHFLRKA